MGKTVIRLDRIQEVEMEADPGIAGISQEAQGAIDAFKRGGVQTLREYLRACRKSGHEPDPEQLCQAIALEILEAFEHRHRRFVCDLREAASAVIDEEQYASDEIDRRIACAFKLRADDLVRSGRTDQRRRYRDAAINIVLCRNVAREVFDGRRLEHYTVLPQTGI
ncbi:hypothetical protein KW792_00810 [Candidatus Saccharibacteria bacterium]|nr:hypothetical protein [Candidatus Saccharibacteria bacterium]